MINARIGLRLNEEMIENLDRIAKAEGVSLSKLVRLAIRKYLDEHGRIPEETQD